MSCSCTADAAATGSLVTLISLHGSYQRYDHCFISCNGITVKLAVQVHVGELT